MGRGIDMRAGVGKKRRMSNPHAVDLNRAQLPDLWRWVSRAVEHSILYWLAQVDQMTPPTPAVSVDHLHPPVVDAEMTDNGIRNHQPAGLLQGCVAVQVPAPESEERCASMNLCFPCVRDPDEFRTQRGTVRSTMGPGLAPTLLSGNNIDC